MIMTKRTIILSVSLILIILLAYFSVSKIRNTETLISTQSEVTKNEEKSVTEKKIEDKNDFYTISAVYPVDVLDKANTIENFITGKVEQKKEDWKIGGDAYNEEKKIEKDFPDRPKMEYQYSITYKKYESKKWGTVSYVFTTYEYTGGANGNITVATFTFDNQGLVMIDSILDFNNGNDIPLTRLMRDVLLKRENASAEMINDGLGLAYLKDDGKTFDAKKCGCDGFFFPSNFQNFVVEDGGLRFIFNKYQVAPGSDGLPEIVMLYDTLKEYLLSPFK